ncbi:Transcriptional regulatory protein TcrA [Neorhodopirellula pilleata]|uniref:Transcriptional regulatory protein TcrA n=2 Tax=Neorhodopirellula pilleata TaxID=2714738 RepID=A0A5C6A8T3_9BACT|nr:Transcriptional regulatory protein TcrA [Neorhodopirellula pilleata]
MSLGESPSEVRYGAPPENAPSQDTHRGEVIEWIHVESVEKAFPMLEEDGIDGIWLSRSALPQVSEIRGIVQSGIMLRDMPEGVALVDSDLRIIWANRRLLQWAQREEGVPLGMTFYELLHNPEIMGPDFCPFHTSLATGDQSQSTLHSENNRYFKVHAAPIQSQDISRQLIVTVSDITEEILQEQKLAAIHQAGRELADLRPNEIFMMEVDERIDLLKDNIQHYLRDLLSFDVIEIRVLEQTTGNLLPLLSVGIDEEASDRRLLARMHENGITGYVAASGLSYICHDVLNDPLFIPGVANARSSLTVPLILHDQVLGTINVESPEVSAFSDSDLQFLEIFARDVAFALNTLELLVAQKANTAQQSCDAIHSAVAMPVDAILNDAVHVMEGYIGHSPEVMDRLGRILQNSRDIKRTIQQIGEKMTPLEAVPADEKSQQHGMLRGKRILVVDEDDQVREDAHRLLERYGCIVETAHEGDEAVLMVRRSGGEDSYDAIISDIRLPDYSGYQLMLRLEKVMDHVPMILMTGFGYDPGHSIVKAKQNGLHPKAVLFKPFRLDQLIDVLKTVLEANPSSVPPA